MKTCCQRGSSPHSQRLTLFNARFWCKRGLSIFPAPGSPSGGFSSGWTAQPLCSRTDAVLLLPSAVQRRKQHTCSRASSPNFQNIFSFAPFLSLTSPWEGCLAATGCVYCAWQLAANAEENNADFLCTVILLSDLFYRWGRKKKKKGNLLEKQNKCDTKTELCLERHFLNRQCTKMG